ncbi:MAG: thioredoxin domain-containing protein [bacterium]|nr:thioredoxin domain-containing protein [bacterium]
MEINNENKSGFFEALGSRKTFVFGIVAGIMTLSTIGFFFLLLSGSVDFDSIGSSTNSKTTFGTANTNTKVTNTAPTAAPTTQIDIVPVTSDDHIRGDLATAEVVVVEFSDTECPFCARFHPTMQQVYEDYAGQVAWVYRHFPLDSLHSKARKEAEATECAAELGGEEGFWAYVDRLYDITPSNNGLEVSQLAEIATFVGLDATQFQTCLDSGKYADKVETHVSDATASGGTGTPYSVAISKDGQLAPINGAQPITSVKATIDALL